MLQGEFPLKCSFIEGDRLAVITNRSIRIYDSKFKQISEQSFAEGKIAAFDANSNGAVAVINNGVQKNVYAYDSDGDKIFDGVLSDNVSSVSVCGGYLFFRTVSGVIRIDASSDEKQFLPSDSGSMLIYDENTAVVCGDAKAEYLVFDD